jgi:hypothetical protein
LSIPPTSKIIIQKKRLYPILAFVKKCQNIIPYIVHLLNIFFQVSIFSILLASILSIHILPLYNKERNFGAYETVKVIFHLKVFYSIIVKD